MVHGKRTRETTKKAMITMIWTNGIETDAGHPDAAGVGALDLDDRVRRAVAPLRGPLTKSDAFSGPTDFVSTARKAAQAAAAAATEHSQNSKAL